MRISSPLALLDFHSKTAPPRGVEQVETKARNDIEDKKQQLRQLVGGSYRYWCAACIYLGY